MGQKQEKLAYRKKLDEDAVDLGPDPLTSLAHAVVLLAVLDWRRIRAGRHIPGWDLDRIRFFLQTPWCDLLLTGTKLNGEKILRRLEAET